MCACCPLCRTGIHFVPYYYHTELQSLVGSQVARNRQDCPADKREALVRAQKQEVLDWQERARKLTRSSSMRSTSRASTLGVAQQVCKITWLD